MYTVGAKHGAKLLYYSTWMGGWTWRRAVVSSSRRSSACGFKSSTYSSQYRYAYS